MTTTVIHDDKTINGITCAADYDDYDAGDDDKMVIWCTIAQVSWAMAQSYPPKCIGPKIAATPESRLHKSRLHKSRQHKSRTNHDCTHLDGTNIAQILTAQITIVQIAIAQIATAQIVRQIIFCDKLPPGRSKADALLMALI